MVTSVNAANQVVSVGADVAFDADPKFFACLVRFESSSVPTTLPPAYDVYPLDGRHDGGQYTWKGSSSGGVLGRPLRRNVYLDYRVLFYLAAPKAVGEGSLNEAIEESGGVEPGELLDQALEPFVAELVPVAPAP